MAGSSSTMRTVGRTVCNMPTLQKFFCAIYQTNADDRSAGLVRAVRQGKYKLHYLDTEPIRTVVARWLKSEKKGRQR